MSLGEVESAGVIMGARRARLLEVSHEDYVSTIYRLREVYGLVKLSDISRELGVKPSTTFKALSHLERIGLVKRCKYREVTLTDKGENLARRIVRKHRIAEAFLAYNLGVDIFDSHYYAHYLEHLPDELVERMYILAGYPQKCPHGNVIPGTEITETSVLATKKHTKLSEAVRGFYRVERIAGEFSTILPALKELQLKPGMIIEVVEQTPRYTVIRQDQVLREVSKHVAFIVILEPVFTQL